MVDSPPSDSDQSVTSLVSATATATANDTSIEANITAPPASAVPGDPIPRSWFRYGTHYQADQNTAQVFAITAIHRSTDDELDVRYVHPINSQVQLLTFQTAELSDGGIVPKPLAQKKQAIDDGTSLPPDFSPFPNSFGVKWEDAALDDECPTDAERRLLWALHHNYLTTNTIYHPNETVV